MLDTTWAVTWAKLTAESMQEHRAELIELDREIGDADHGENMARGFNKVAQGLDQGFATPADVLKFIASTLISTVGGASGPLYGTAYLRAAKAIAGKETLDGHDVSTMLAAMQEGIVARGKAEVGDKTMVDAWEPAVQAAQQAGSDSPEVLHAAYNGALNGAESTDALQAKKGRASYLAERSIGHRDPGAQSTVYILEAAVQATQ